MASGSTRPSPSNARVLIVDDDEVVSGAVFQYLVATGVRTDLALDPGSAELLLASNAYGLILVDAYLTGQLNARPLELVDRMRELGRDSHILVLTAYTSAPLAERASRYPRMTLVAKPKSVTYIAGLIGTLLAGGTEH
jgi:DNA-binding NtrC family response regulator